jgi:aspartate aminotransferase
MINEKAYALGVNRSGIRDLFEYGQKRAAEVGRENVFDYSMGNPSLPTPVAVHDAIQEILTREEPLAIHGYTSASGDIQARQAIANDLNRRFSAGARPEDLFLTAGAAPALVAAFRALATPGAEVLAIAPHFPEYKPFAEDAGLIFRVVPPDVPNFQIRLDVLEDMLTERTAAIILNSPNNPSGTVYTQDTLQKLADLLRSKAAEYGHPIYIIADEPYRELVYGDAQVSFIPNIYADTIVCYSYSKSLSLPGERIGYIYVPRQAACHDGLKTAIAGASRVMGHVCAPSLWQKVIARCAHLGPDLAAYDRNRRTLADALTEFGYEIARPDGAFYLFMKAPDADAKAFSEKAKKQDLLLVPGDDFGCPGWLRLCYCVSYDTIVKSLPIFKALLEE